jgi:anti-sigma B factor antagonist
MPTPDWLTISVTTAGDGRQVVHLSGELDLATAPQLADALTATIASDGVADVVIDLDALSFIDAAGLDVILHAHHHARRSGRILTARNPHGEVDTVLRITGVANQLDIPDVPPFVAEPHPVTSTGG